MLRSYALYSRSRQRLCRFPFTLCLCLLAYSLSPAVSALEKTDLLTVRATGYAEGVGQQSYQFALEDAQRTTVIDILNKLIPAADLRYLRSMLRRADSYIYDYRVLRTDVEENSTRVEIDARLHEASIRRDAATLMLPRLPAMPRVQLILGEQLEGDKIMAVHEFTVAESVLMETAEHYRLQLRNSAALEKEYSIASLMALLDGDAEAVGRFAQGLDVDVVVVGKVNTSATDLPDDNSTATMAAHAEFRLFSAINGNQREILESRSEIRGRNLAAMSEQSADDVCRKMMPALIESIILTVLGNVPTEDVLLVIKNVGTPARLAAIKTRLATLLPSAPIEELSYTENLAKLRMPYTGPMLELVNTLTLDAYGDDYLDAREVIGRRLELVFE